MSKNLIDLSSVIGSWKMRNAVLCYELFMRFLVRESHAGDKTLLQLHGNCSLQLAAVLMLQRRNKKEQLGCCNVVHKSQLYH